MKLVGKWINLGSNIVVPNFLTEVGSREGGIEKAVEETWKRDQEGEDELGDC